MEKFQQENLLVPPKQIFQAKFNCSCNFAGKTLFLVLLLFLKLTKIVHTIVLVLLFFQRFYV